MLYIIKRLSDSYYLDFFESAQEKSEFTFTSLISDALKLLRTIAEFYICMIREIKYDECDITPAK